MSVAIEINALNSAALAVIEEAKRSGIQSIPDCLDLSDEEQVKKYLNSFAQKEFKFNTQILPGTLYGCAFRGIFIVFEELKNVASILPAPISIDSAPNTHLAVFWKVLL